MREALWVFFLDQYHGPRLATLSLMGLAYYRWQLIPTYPVSILDGIAFGASVVFWLVQEHALHLRLLHSKFDWMGKTIHEGHHAKPYFHISLDPGTEGNLVYCTVMSCNDTMDLSPLPLPLAIHSLSHHGLVFHGSCYILLGTTPHQNEYSASNRFMFWRTKNLRKQDIPRGWKAPTENVKLSYSEWLSRAKQMENSSDKDQVNQDHWYFRINGAFGAHGQANDFLYDELPFFQPDEPSFFMVDHDQGKGINCRFGMKGVIAEAHFDSTRNFVMLLGGRRRYILAHPDQCTNMELYPLDHPSSRNSRVDWSNPPNTGPFSRAMVNEVVLQAGDALYRKYLDYWCRRWFCFVSDG